MTREDLFKLHQQMSETALELMRKKNADYSASGPFGNFHQCERLGIASTEAGILVRMSDKLARVASIVQKGEAAVKSESVEDTLIDLMNYCVCLAGVLSEKKAPIASTGGNLGSDYTISINGQPPVRLGASILLKP